MVGIKMKYAIIENGIVSNIALSDEPLAENWVKAGTADIGDLWDGKKFSKPKASEADIADKWEQNRLQRNARLASSDWTQLPDAPVDALVWATYRQALRDITEAADPFAVVWPTAPQT
jgi:hypothetical protein